MSDDYRQQETSNWFQTLRELIIKEFELIEEEFAIYNSLNNPGKFTKKAWERKGGGGGEMAVMRGNIFEKVGVNFSSVFGEFPQNTNNPIPGTERDPSFYATGISLVAHMCSPLVPACHFNTRYIETEKSWFGGGADLTPTYPEDSETDFFHQNFKKTCDKFDEKYYEEFKKYCDEYFFLPHRNEPRGVGGIFFDYLNSNNYSQDFEFIKSVGETLRITLSSIIRSKMYENWTNEMRETQLIKRGRYVEFNLLYDRGTKFGLETNGDTEAILMSLPPIVKWS
jgi:coproporphyrinogen III oxidase